MSHNLVLKVSSTSEAQSINLIVLCNKKSSIFGISSFGKHSQEYTKSSRIFREYKCSDVPCACIGHDMHSWQDKQNFNQKLISLAHCKLLFILSVQQVAWIFCRFRVVLHFISVHCTSTVLVYEMEWERLLMHLNQDLEILTAWFAEMWSSRGIVYQSIWIKIWQKCRVNEHICLSLSLRILKVTSDLSSAVEAKTLSNEILLNILYRFNDEGLYSFVLSVGMVVHRPPGFRSKTSGQFGLDPIYIWSGA